MKRLLLLIFIGICFCLGVAEAQENKRLKTTDISEFLKTKGNQKAIGKLSDLKINEKDRIINKLQSLGLGDQENMNRYVHKNNQLLVEVYVKDIIETKDILSELKSIGFVLETKNAKVILGWLPVDKIEELGKMPKIAGVIPISPIATNSSMLKSSTKKNDQLTEVLIESDFNDFTGYGLANNQAAAAVRSNIIRENFKVSGKNVKVGIISNSFNLTGNMEQSILDGDLPGPGNPNGFEQPITILREDVPGPILFNTDEGRGMAELIHDLAPDAELYFHTGLGDSQLAFANAIRELANAGCDIIVDDLYVIGGSGSVYQEDVISEAVDEVTSNGSIYFSSAGNYADGSSENVYKFHESSYNPVAVDIQQGTFIFHQFNDGSVVLPIDVSTGTTTLDIIAEWSSPSGSRCENCPSSNYDINFIFFDENFNILNFIQPDVEGDSKTNGRINFNFPNNSTVFVGLLSTFESFDFPERVLLTYNIVESTATIDSLIVEDLFRNTPTIRNQSNAASTITVGATAWFNTFDGANYWNNNIAGTILGDGTIVDPIAVPNIPILSYTGAPSAIFDFATGDENITNTSIGGIGLYFDKEGNPFATDNLGNIIPKINNKPDIIAPAGVTNTVLGRSTQLPNKFFFGTSASAPNAAGIAALLFQASNYTFNAEQMRNAMIATTQDMDNPYLNGYQSDINDPLFSIGFDFASGNGFLQADSAIEGIIEQVGVENLIVVEVCSENPLSERRYMINNPNGFGIEVTIGTTTSVKLQDGSTFVDQLVTVVPPGESYFLVSLPQQYNNSFISLITSANIRYNQPASPLGITRLLLTGFGQVESCNENIYGRSFYPTGSKSSISGLTIFPNPSKSGVFNVLIEDAKDNTNFEVYDMTGKCIMKSKRIDFKGGYNTLKIDLSKYNEGVYILKIRSGNENFVKKLIL
ncbi:S8 family serine peptidase [uncultured Kordia sp.]|uniref:S8 family serine peptidase n=1 Tax=uncultured Kordia sp. TaxID=507699 RepID=UPI002601C136|nr:S8 family serine peptidase [uncultured Kordia sp.]